MKTFSLAIVIPAYKPQFFRAALESIAAQTDKNFTCYIFDDAAPEEIKAIADRYPEFHYTRFNENMGGRDLVGHWHRCLEPIKEEWVWLFSDDDVMEPNCVEEFYKSRKLYPNATVFRFPRNVIDENGRLTHAALQIKNETGLEFLYSKISGQTSSCLQDHIFNWKKLLEINGGFLNLPLAWGSDDAAWCLLGEIHEIIAIPSASVQIRNSGINISSSKDIKNMKIKLSAYRKYYLWCSRKFDLPLSYKLQFAKHITVYHSNLPLLYFFRPPLFSSPIFILSILFALDHKIRLMLVQFTKRIGIYKPLKAVKTAIKGKT